MIRAGRAILAALAVTVGIGGPLIAADTRAPRCAFLRGPDCGVQPAIGRRMMPTWLTARFPAGARCPQVDEGWAIDYSDKRPFEVLHGGIDMPAPFGTPIIAVADGEVIVVIASSSGSYRGREVWLRHSPDQTGLPYWLFTQHTHFDGKPVVREGERVRMGQMLGPTGNSGRDGSGRQSPRRRPAVHFAAAYAPGPGFELFKGAVVPQDGWWMDPIALYRGDGVVESLRLSGLPAEQKRVSVPVIYADGSLSSAGARIIWPYRCSR